MKNLLKSPLQTLLIFCISIALLTNCKKESMVPDATAGPLIPQSGGNLFGTRATVGGPSTTDSIQIFINAAQTTNCTIRVLLGKNSITTYNSTIDSGNYNQTIYFHNYSNSFTANAEILLNGQLWEFPLFIIK